MAGTMHLSPVQKVVYALVEGEAWEGDVESPSGAWTDLRITEETREQVVREAGHDIGAEIVGFWLIIENSDGFVMFFQYPTERGLDDAIRALETMYERWSDS